MKPKFEVGDIIRATSGSILPKNRDFRVMRIDFPHIHIGLLDGGSVKGVLSESESQFTREGWWDSHEVNYILVRRIDACGDCSSKCRRKAGKCSLYMGGI